MVLLSPFWFASFQHLHLPLPLPELMQPVQNPGRKRFGPACQSSARVVEVAVQRHAPEADGFVKGDEVGGGGICESGSRVVFEKG